MAEAGRVLPPAPQSLCRRAMARTAHARRLSPPARLADRLLPAVTVRMGHPRFLTAMALGACVCDDWDTDAVAADEITPPWLVWEWFVVEAFVCAADSLSGISGIPGIQKVQRALRNQRPLSATAAAAPTRRRVRVSLPVEIRRARVFGDVFGCCRTPPRSSHHHQRRAPRARVCMSKEPNAGLLIAFVEPGCCRTPALNSRRAASASLAAPLARA